MLKKFSEIVSRIRTVQGELSTVEFARRLGMTQQTVDLYLKEARKPSLEFVLKVCSTFDESSDWLLGLTDMRVPAVGTASDDLQQQIALLKKDVQIAYLRGKDDARREMAEAGGRSARPAKTGGATAAKTA